jgi:hypothetical protein
MADSAEMVNLMRHAASRLAEERQRTHDTIAVVIAMAYAEAVLSLVASCVAEPTSPNGRLVSELRRMCEETDVYVRADEVLELLGEVSDGQQ